MMIDEKKQNDASSITEEELVESVEKELLEYMKGNVVTLSASCIGAMVFLNHTFCQFINSIFENLTDDDKRRLINIALANMELDMLTKKAEMSEVNDG